MRFTRTERSLEEHESSRCRLVFLATLFNHGVLYTVLHCSTLVNAKLMRGKTAVQESLLEDEDLDEVEVEAENGREGSSRLVLQIKSLFQVTPMQVMNAHDIYEKCRSRELITAFSKQSACTNYKSMKLQRTNLAKYTILMSLEVGGHHCQAILIKDP